MNSQEITVLHVDPDETTREEVAENVESFDDMRVTGVSDFESGVAEIESGEIDCIISAYNLGDNTAFDLFREGRGIDPSVGCVLFTSEGIADIDRTGVEDLVVEYLSKRIPGTGDRLPDLVRSVVVNRMQVGYPVTDNEDARQEAVERYAMDDLVTSPAFDRILTLVKAHFDVDVAFIGIMHDTREEIVACKGEQWSVLDRENTICTYAMLDGDVTVIEDVNADPRFEHNERLDELGITSYAGANLTTPDGQVIGELCLADRSTRFYDEAERESLQLYADELVEQLELRRRLPEDEQTASPGE